MHVEVPPALTGNFTFTPQIEATGAPILAPGSVTLFVSTGGFGNPPDEGIVIPIEVTYDPTQKRQITYSPDAVQVAGKTTGLITLTIKTVGTGTPATFNGFAPNLQPSGSLSPWPDAMKILVTTSKITIVDPNLPGEGISGQSFGFSPIYNFPAGSVTSNPDPTIANADIPPVDLGPDQVIV
jgi:hypothetical protein